MARPTTTPRPTHIALPTNNYARISPNGSPSGTPAPLASPTSPRSSFLPNFIRNRSRAATITGRSSPRTEQADPIRGYNLATVAPAAAGSGARETSGGAGRDGGGVTRSVSTPIGGVLGGTETSAAGQTPIDPKGKTHRIRLVPHLENSRSLAFDPVIRELYPIDVHSGIAPSVAASRAPALAALVNGKPPALVLKIGRFTDKAPAENGDGGGTENRPATGIGGATIPLSGGGGEITSSKIAFKSKVVSRTHAELWCEAGGKFYIRDTSSSSGTFLNHIRLSSPNTDSRPTQLNDGDVLQLGVDYQGGHEDQFRCVKMRVELGREWQRAANEFNTNALKQLKALGGAPPATPDAKGKGAEVTPGSSSKKSRGSVTDCCICLFSVTVCQSLFIAPCSHVFHYKCIRPLLMQHHPGFSCPLCRTFANLEEDVETEDAWEMASRRASVISRRPSNHSLRVPRLSENGQTGTGDIAGEVGTEVALGGGSASVQDLLAGGQAADAILAGEIEPAGEDDYTDTSASHSQILPAAPHGGDNADAPIMLGGLSISAPNAESSRRSSYDPLPTAAIPDVQTPMNDYFLSTLAPGSLPAGSSSNGMPGVHQQLERADAVSTIPEEAEGSGGSSVPGHRAETTLTGGEQQSLDAHLDEAMPEYELDERRRRAESEMMYS